MIDGRRDAPAIGAPGQTMSTDIALVSADQPLLPVKPARLRLRPMLLALLCWLGCAAAIALATRGYLEPPGAAPRPA